MLVHWDEEQVAQRWRKSITTKSERSGLQVSDGLSGGKSPLTPLQGGSCPEDTVLSNFCLGPALGNLLAQVCQPLKHGQPDMFHLIFKFFKPIPKAWLLFKDIFYILDFLDSCCICQPVRNVGRGKLLLQCDPVLFLSCLCELFPPCFHCHLGIRPLTSYTIRFTMGT